jgi:NitT/TauT family transport system ATP-binding protein
MLMMDEPFGALDALTREPIAMDIQRLWMERRMRALHITHRIPEVVPRPGRILEIIDINLPRPRRLDMLQASSTPTRREFATPSSKGVLAMD